MKKEENIQRNQNIIAAIDASVAGLAKIAAYFEGEQEPYTIHDLGIGFDFHEYHYNADRINISHMQDAIEEARNNYVALLQRWDDLTKKELAQLLTNNKNHE